MTTIAHGLTPHQRNAFGFIASYIDRHGYSPSYDEIRQHLNLRSKSGVSRVVDELEERGHINRLKHKDRSITIRSDVRAQAMPLPALPPHIDAKLNAYCLEHGEARMAVIADAIELFLDQREADIAIEQQGPRQ